MAHSDMERTEASHRDAEKAAISRLSDGTVMLINERNELLGEEVLVTSLAVERVHVEGLPGVRHDHQKRSDLALSEHAVQKFLAAAVRPASFVLKHAVKEVEHRISFV